MTNPAASWTFFAASTVALAALAGCAAPPVPSPAVGMANPASVYCAQRGGRLEIVKRMGAEQGLCHLPDGTVVEEWELFRRDHSNQ
ncbi:putative hemolysin [Pulveribacter suum]|uniref:DUF333 domain-containing protein n=1 Tax=Pulveribacter suum TaxID=2116657 RepID=A0A2P1NP12_9BURK|nr:DUF333 domain-containing protein [Pulveribacter suum]AVP58791.1 DUF333 domain-containing protein [Pulveribacter suum]